MKNKTPLPDDVYRKCVLPTENRHKKLQKVNRKNWIKNNWINLLTLIFTFLTLIATVLLGLLQLFGVRL